MSQPTGKDPNLINRKLRARITLLGVTAILITTIIIAYLHNARAIQASENSLIIIIMLIALAAMICVIADKVQQIINDHFDRLGRPDAE